MADTLHWTFKRYLQARRETDTPQGDFTRDALADPTFPDATTWREVRDHLVAKRAAAEAIAAGRGVFQQYLRGRRLRAGRPVQS